jgi:hypothetical protein
MISLLLLGERTKAYQGKVTPHLIPLYPLTKALFVVVAPLIHCDIPGKNMLSRGIMRWLLGHLPDL